jgi:hypothetical protein
MFKISFYLIVALNFASVIRNSPSGLLNAPVMMIVEKVSDMIKHHRKHQTQTVVLNVH